ncbi:metal-dependent hydrolase [Agromyces humatus]|uniref:Metal-dependent hydrolase n=1 Tax=Agromyces humatus TaxID=279573 RepID=A0ABP4XB33_9MICO|nr:metal-dependent hydrolase [Agromyces humatus]
MTLPAADTRVTYPAGELEATARVVHVAPAGDGRLAIITDVTSFHPVDAAWPDQPADTGTISVGGAELAVRDAVVAATDGETLALGADIPVRKGTEGWAFLVAHLVDDGAAIAEGDEVVIRADAATRRSLSLGHTACHAASLALNQTLAGRWSKPAREDPLGNPDFDGIAIASSRIEPNGSVDRYRLNKSLRRAGFDVAGLADDLAALGDTVTQTMAGWAAAGASVHVERDGDLLTDRRRWVADLPPGVARIDCGGTHVASLADMAGAQVSFELDDDQGTPVLSMRTRVRADR